MRASRWIRIVVLAAALLVAAFLRLDGLGEPSYWFDEVLHQKITTESLAEPWWRWIVGFEPENGPLYYATQLATRVAGSSEAAGRSAAAVFGLATIALAWLASREREGWDTTSFAFDAAPLLLAVAPLHVYYSREARHYSLLMLLTAAMIVILLRGRSLRAAIVVLVLLVYTAAAAAPILAAVAATALLLAVLTRERWYALVGAGAVVATGVLPLLYRGASHPARSRPSLDAMTILRHFSVATRDTNAGGRAAVFLFVLAVIGGVVALRRDRRQGIVLLGMTLGPALVALAALVFFGREYAPRYIAPALVGYLLLAGAALASLTRRLGRAAPVVVIAVAIAFGTQSWPACRTEPWQKLHWRLIAAKIREYARPGDLVMTADAWSEVSLAYYLQREPVRVEQLLMPHVSLAERLVRPGTWLVSTGITDDDSMRRWMCRYPLVLSSSHDGFRMHYAGDFVRERSRLPEQRALARALGDDVLFADGWEGEEGTGADSFRWALGERATLLLPRIGIRDRVLDLDVLPVDHPSLPRQTVAVSLNGKHVTSLTLPNRWSEPRIAIPARYWIDGLNVLTFEFGRAAAPADLDPRSPDRRRLAVAFHRPRTRPVETHIASMPLLDENSTWRRTTTRLPAERLNERSVMAIVARLGFDPVTTWPRLHSGELRLDDLVESLAFGSDCMDDRTFVAHAFTLLLGRAPGEAELRSLLGIPRVRVAGRIAKSQEFRANVLIR